MKMIIILVLIPLGKAVISGRGGGGTSTTLKFKRTISVYLLPYHSILNHYDLNLTLVYIYLTCIMHITYRNYITCILLILKIFLKTKSELSYLISIL